MKPPPWWLGVMIVCWLGLWVGAIAWIGSAVWPLVCR